MTRAFLLAATLVLTACNRPVIQGVVVNLQGETLPGVAVRVADTDYNALTNALGEYAIPYPTGIVQLEFYKSGYTMSRLALEIPERQPIQAELVQMRRLPSNAGVYLFENYRYLDTTRVEPKRFFLDDGQLIYGTERIPATGTGNLQPMIVTFNMPRYDARLTRLTKTPATRTATSEDIVEIWAEAGTMRPELVTVTDHDPDLLQFHLDAPLEPGVWAVHYGALDGYTVLDNRLHLFYIGEPPALPELEGEGEAEGQSELPEAPAGVSEF